MRLTTKQTAIIKQTTTKIVGENTQVFLFGSRTDDTKKGGDIDLLIETTFDLDILKQAQLKNLLELQLNLPVDVLILQYGTHLTPFQKIAVNTGILL